MLRVKDAPPQPGTTDSIEFGSVSFVSPRADNQSQSSLGTTLPEQRIAAREDGLQPAALAPSRKSGD
jgi:hypothetical protein